ncbi:MAG: HAMP domain-containing protein [Elusimicrobia bacterium]|nr:HAMP domain-containing protein [Elusimicrobiota bacterium]
MPPKRIPLALQVFAAVSVAVGLVFGASFIHDMVTLTNRLEARQVARLQAMSPLIGRIIEESMEKGNPAHIGDFFRILAQHRGAGVAELLDADGGVVDPANLKALRAPAAAISPGTVSLEVPISAKPSCARCHGVSEGRLGTLRLVAPLDDRRELRHSLVLSRLAMAGIGAAAVALASLIIVRWLVHAPLRAVVGAMRGIAAGKLDTRIEGELPGELQHIAEGFNTMASELARERAESVELHRKELAHLDRLATLGELAAQLAHEVRNPLTGLSSALQVLERESAENPSRRGLIEKMLAQLQRMDRTMGDFLRYARLPEAAPRPVALKEALSRVLFLLGPRMRAQGVELALALPGELPLVQGDPGQLEQVFLNLALNAVQAMPGGGRLEIAGAVKDASTVVVTVADTGSGIAPEVLERIFEPFFTTKDGGSGLGLSITRQIAMAHGGELWLESEPGVGTTAHVRLPRAKEAA